MTDIIQNSVIGQEIITNDENIIVLSNIMDKVLLIHSNISSSRIGYNSKIIRTTLDSCLILPTVYIKNRNLSYRIVYASIYDSVINQWIYLSFDKRNNRLLMEDDGSSIDINTFNLSTYLTKSRHLEDLLKCMYFNVRLMKDVCDVEFIKACMVL